MYISFKIGPTGSLGQAGRILGVLANWPATLCWAAAREQARRGKEVSSLSCTQSFQEPEFQEHTLNHVCMVGGIHLVMMFWKLLIVRLSKE